MILSCLATYRSTRIVGLTFETLQLRCVSLHFSGFPSPPPPPPPSYGGSIRTSRPCKKIQNAHPIGIFTLNNLALCDQFHILDDSRNMRVWDWRISLFHHDEQQTSTNVDIYIIYIFQSSFEEKFLGF